MSEKKNKVKSQTSQKRDVEAITFYVTSGEKKMFLEEAKRYRGISNYIRLRLELPPHALGRKLKKSFDEVIPAFEIEPD